MIDEFFTKLLTFKHKDITLKELLSDYSMRKKHIAMKMNIRITGRTFQDFGILTCLPGSKLAIPIKLDDFLDMLFEAGFRHNHYDLCNYLRDCDMYIESATRSFNNRIHRCYIFDLQKVINKYMRQ